MKIIPIFGVIMSFAFFLGSARGEQVTLFFDNMESGTNGWTSTGSTNGIDEGPNYWHLSTAEYWSSSHSWRYADPAVGGYPSDSDNWGLLQSPAISVTNVTNALLTVKMSIAYESQYPFWDDSASIMIYDGTNWISHAGFYWQDYCCFGAWDTITVDLTEYVGKTIHVGFYINTSCECLNQDLTECDHLEPGPGWFVDDVKVTGNR